MPILSIYARHGSKYYRLDVSQQWAVKNDNGALFSCGLTVGTDISEKQLKHLISRGQATEVTKEKYDHSGCQSGCILRGDRECRW